MSDSSSMLSALCQWLTRAGASLRALGNTLRHALQLLFSFNALIIASFLAFLILGAALACLIFSGALFDDDEYDECENGRGAYYRRPDNDSGRWLGVAAVPVIVVERSRSGARMAGRAAPLGRGGTPKSDKRGKPYY